MRRAHLSGEMNMDNIELVKAYFAALDAGDMQQAEQYLSDQYQLVNFTPQTMDKSAMLDMMAEFKVAMPNLNHSLSNIRVEENVVKLTVQLSGHNSENLDLRKLGIGIVPSSKKFIIFPNGNYEMTINNGKIMIEKDVSPTSVNRRMSGMLKALGINMAALSL
jgi:predicted ester cyclase